MYFRVLLTYISESIDSHARPISGNKPIMQWHFISIIGIKNQINIKFRINI